MLVLCFIVFIGILFAVNVYVFENSQFSKITGHSFISAWMNKRIRFLYKLTQKLTKVNGEKKLLVNIVLPESERKIDFILLHQSGMYVINAKQPGGWIYGNEQDIHWAQVLENGKMNKIYNPIIETKILIADLEKYIPEIDKDLYHSMIVFNNNCSFKKIEVNSPEVDVLKINELKIFWENRMDQSFTKDQMMSIYSSLEPYMQKKQPKEMPLKNAASN